MIDNKSFYLHFVTHLSKGSADLHDIQTLVLLNFEHPADELLQVRVNLQGGWEVAALGDILPQGVKTLSNIPRHEATQGLVEHDSKTPHITLDAIRLTCKDLRSHIARGADAGCCHSLFFDDLDKSEVCDFNIT